MTIIAPRPEDLQLQESTLEALLDLPQDALEELIDEIIDRLELEEDDEEEEEEDDEPVHSGTMVALAVPLDDALELAIPDGEAPEDLHLTLAYLGEADDLDEVAQARIVVAIDSIAARTAPFQGKVSGLGRFQGDSEEGTDVLYASVDSPDLSSFRERLCQELTAACGREPSREHGFTPHITLMYVPSGFVSPVDSVPDLELDFDHLIVAFAGEQILIELRGPEGIARPDHHGYMGEAFAEAQTLDLDELLEAFEATDYDANPTTSSGTKKRKPLTPEHRAKISAALKARARNKAPDAAKTGEPEADPNAKPGERGHVNEDGSIDTGEFSDAAKAQRAKEEREKKARSRSSRSRSGGGGKTDPRFDPNSEENIQKQREIDAIHGKTIHPHQQGREGAEGPPPPSAEARAVAAEKRAAAAEKRAIAAEKRAKAEAATRAAKAKSKSDEEPARKPAPPKAKSRPEKKKNKNKNRSEKNRKPEKKNSPPPKKETSKKKEDRMPDFLQAKKKKAAALAETLGERLARCM